MMNEIMIPSGISGNAITIKNMWRLVNQDTKDESLINIATAIVRDIPASDHFSQFNALFNWVKNNINFITNPTGVQMVQDSFRTIQRRAGACTDQTVLLSSLAQSIGFIVRFKAIMTIEPNGKDSEFQHIYPQVLLDGKWLSADTTEPMSYLGWESAIVFGERIWNNPIFKDVMGNLIKIGLGEIDNITDELSKLITDESINKMKEMSIPVNDQNIQLMALQITDSLKKNPEVVELLVNPPATDVEYPELGLGKGLTKKQQKKHKAAINAQFEIKNNNAATIDAEFNNAIKLAGEERDKALAEGYTPESVNDWYNAQIESINEWRKEEDRLNMEAFNNNIAGIKERADKIRKVNNQQKLVKSVVAAAAVVTGAILLAPSLTTGGSGSALALINTAKETATSPLSIVNNIIPGAGDAITNITGKSPDEIKQVIDTQLKKDTEDIKQPSIVTPTVPVGPTAPTTIGTKKTFPVKYLIVGGVAVFAIGGIIYFSKNINFKRRI